MKPHRLQITEAATCLWVVLLGLALDGCRLLEGNPPIRYLSARLVQGEEPGCHRVAGLHYTIENLDERVISAVHASFDLYDDEGLQMPAPAANHFDAAFLGSIAPYSIWTICISLDTAFYFQPTVDLVAERFRVYWVEFSDGSSWSDPFALYVYPYRVTTRGSESDGETSP